jgi:hypothetical protein
LFMVQRCKFSIELKNFPPDLSGEPKRPSDSKRKKDIKKGDRKIDLLF